MRMRVRHIACAVLTVLLLFAIHSGIFLSFAQTQALAPKNKSYAWLEDVFFREKSGQFRLNAIIPLPDFPYSRTLADFRLEVRGYIDGYNAGFEGISQEARMFLNLAEVLFRSMGITETYEEQRDWLETNHGVVFPEKKDENTETYTLILFTLLKYDITSQLVGLDGLPVLTKEIEIPYGVTLEQGILIFLLTAFKTDSDISQSDPGSFSDIIYELIRAILMNYQNNKYGVTAATSQDDLLRYSAMMAAESVGGYTVESDASDLVVDTYTLLTTIQMRYGINIEPGKMAAILEMKDADAQAEALARLILETMILEKGGSATKSMTTADLFSKTLSYGYFPLGEDFYSDVYNYRVELKYKRSDIWFTPICYADLMPTPGKRSFVKIKVNGVTVEDRMPYKVSLDSAKAQQTMKVEVGYNDGKINQNKTYQFLIVQGKTEEPNNSNPKVIDNPDYIQPADPTQPATLADGSVSTVSPSSGNAAGTPNANSGSNSGWNLGARNAQTTAQTGETEEAESQTSSKVFAFVKKWWPYGAGVLLLLLGGGGYVGYTRVNDARQTPGKERKPKKDDRF